MADVEQLLLDLQSASLGLCSARLLNASGAASIIWSLAKLKVQLSTAAGGAGGGSAGDRASSGISGRASSSGSTAASVSGASAAALSSYGDAPSSSSSSGSSTIPSSWLSPKLVAALVDASGRTLYSANPLALYRIIWGLATLGIRPPGLWLSQFANVAQSKFFEFGGSPLAITAWALARLGWVPDALWLDSFLAAVQARFRQQQQQERGSAAAGGSAAGAAGQAGPITTEAPGGPATASSSSSTGPRSSKSGGPTAMDMDSLNGQNYANIAWALARWRALPSSDWLEAFCGASGALLPVTAPLGVSMLMYSLAMMGHRPPNRWIQDCLGRLTAAKYGGLRGLQPLQDAQILWALAGEVGWAREWG